MAKTQTKYYAVHKGRKEGVFFNWPDCQAQVSGHRGAVFKSFPTLAEAEFFAATGGGTGEMVFYAVARGNTRGIYTSWADCLQAVNGYPDARYKKFDTREEAERFFVRHTDQHPRQEINFVSNHFDDWEGFTARPTLGFAEEFDRLAASQGWARGSETYRRERVVAMSKEVAHHYFPQARPQQPRIKREARDEGSSRVRVKQEPVLDEAYVSDEAAPLTDDEEHNGSDIVSDDDDDASMEDDDEEGDSRDRLAGLTPKQRLAGYQELCREKGRQPQDTVTSQKSVPPTR